ncbi:hypothetical protein NBRC10512_006873 [Rhodotorula toruloides]|uniref:RHTO0S11e06832g1_1 n=2 Tax=Rhodotorula toruloides TaxID=5286 RepID=A0A061B7T3_RHOTO|nr:coiled-coil domain-containing protein 130 [Rhodotorula toruloides NP11]EMS21506.1 coiled-coil domain-containing protein 130 [Rhodotorula toruloides NP11]KAJ8292579.1 Coiled-coil domain-containing protein 130 [Rhodotorula toruloides]CDR45968.1 RHTO0S11e06832g1_1 [Rhodotorula toruloides]
MQGFNKYYPPDYDPNEHKSLNGYHGKHALGKRAHKIDQGILVVRFELPFNIWCNHCSAHIGQGVRYNAEKKKVGNYYSTPIWSFRFKCHLCSGRIEIQTDPQNTRYVVTEGAKQKMEEWDPAENGQMVIDNAASTSTAPPDPFASLEKTVTQKAAALSEAQRLSALQEQNDSHWSDPYAASTALRSSFRKAKKVRLESESRAEGTRGKFALGERIRTEDLRTPARGSEESEWEKREWVRARGEMERAKEEEGRKRRRLEEQVGWQGGKVESESSTRRLSVGGSSRDTSRRTTKALPSASSSSRSLIPRSTSAPSSLSSRGTSNPAAKALHSKLALASAIKNDPFASPLARGSLPRSVSSSSGLGAAVKVVKRSRE